MAAISNRRSVMTLFTYPDCPNNHRVRIVLAEKDINHDVIQVNPNNKPADLVELNPYNDTPTLVDRELVLYDANVIMEYLDERFPHPPLMPVDPVSRAHTRLALYRIEKDWFTLIHDLEHGSERKASRARKTLREGLASATDVFSHKPYFLSDDFSLLDCTMIAILWRLPKYGIDLSPKQARPILEYMERIITRPTFQKSLTETEKAIRP